MLNSLLLNLTIISSFLFLGTYYHNQIRTTPENKKKKRIFAALSFGILGLILMKFSYEVFPNIYIDFRHIPIVLTAVYGGVIPALITSIILAVGQLFLFEFNSVSVFISMMIVFIGLGNGLAYYLSFSKFIKFHLLNMVNLVIIFMCLSFEIGNYEEVLSFFLVYAFLGLVGGYFTFAASEYIIKSAHSLEQLEHTAQKLMSSEEELQHVNSKLLNYSNALHDSEQRYKSLFDYNHDISYMVNNKGNFSNLNKAVEKIAGYSKDDLIGKPFLSIIYEADIPYVTDYYHQVLQGNPTHFEARIKHKLGHLIQLSITALPKVINKKISGVIGIAKDITKERESFLELRESEERYRSLIELSPEAIVVHLEGKIILMNSVGVSGLGFESEKDVINRNINDFIDPDFTSMILSRYKKLNEGEQLSPIEFEVIRKDGEKRNVEASSRLIPFHDEYAILTIMHDITDRKKIEAKLKTELELAKAVQVGVLSAPIQNSDFMINAYYSPSEELSGDMYAWYKIDEHRYGVILYDVMGHGVSSALVNMSVRAVLRGLIVQITNPYTVIPLINNHLIRLYKENSEKINTYLTAIYLVIDTKNKEIQYVNCGHPEGVLFEKDKDKFTLLDEGSVPLGFFEEITLNSGHIRYEGPTQIVLYTDGYFENNGLTIQKGRENLMEVMKEHKLMDQEEIIEYFKKDTERKEQRPDDVCLVVIDLP